MAAIPKADRSKIRNPIIDAIAFIDSYKAPFAAMELANRNIPKILGDGERSARDLAAEAGVDPRALESMLRLLSGYGYFKESQHRPGVFANTELSRALQTCQPYGRFFSHPVLQEVWSEMGHCLETGKSAIQKRFNEPSLVMYAIQKNPEVAGVFFGMLGFLGAQEVPAVLEAYDFSQRRGVMDVGGATGEFLLAIAGRYPGLRRYALFDLPHMANSEQARAAVSRIPSGNGLSIAGDASKSIPRVDGIDTITHKYFLHDFDDERAVLFLKNDFAALPDGGKVLIIEQISKPGSNTPRYANVMDLIMLVNEGGGHVRTVEQHAANLAKAGFKFEREIETAMTISVLEAVKN
jgi:hypothetical protein